MSQSQGHLGFKIDHKGTQKEILWTLARHALICVAFASILVQPCSIPEELEVWKGDDSLGSHQLWLRVGFESRPDSAMFPSLLMTLAPVISFSVEVEAPFPYPGFDV